MHVADAIVSAADPAPLNHDIAMDLTYLGLGLREQEAVWRSLQEKHKAAMGNG